MSRFRLGVEVVFVPPRLARKLDVALSSLRVQTRGDDPELYALLRDLHEAGLEWVERSAVGISDYRADDEGGCSPAMTTIGLLDTAAVASRLGISARAVTGLAARESLQGERVGRRWFFDAVVVDEFAERRSA